MAGHSKWANIKHRKQSVDAKRSQAFQKLILEISKAAENGTDIHTNPALKAVIARAKSANMPKDVITRAIERNRNRGNKQVYWNEARFAKQISLLIKIESDNLIRVTNDLKKITQKSQVEILPGNSIRYLFTLQYYFQITSLDEEKLLNLIDDLEVNNFFINPENVEIIFANAENAKKFHTLLAEAKIAILKQKEMFVPLQKISLPERLSNEYNLIKEKLLQVNEVKDIFDDLNAENSQ